MYYTGIDPRDGTPVYVPRDPHEKAIQRALMQYKNPANRKLVLEGLKKAGRMDLVVFAVSLRTNQAFRSKANQIHPTCFF